MPVKCKHEGCESISPNFNIEGGKGLFCIKHKTAEMIDVKNKRCEQEGCVSQAYFNIKGGKCRFCSKHKTADMIDVKNKRCEHEGCDSRPRFNIKGGKGRFCITHKKVEMVDVITKRCEHEGCDALTTLFDIKGGKGRFCAKHKTEEMIDVKSKRCEQAGCESVSLSYGLKGDKPRFCSNHKTTEMINVKSKHTPSAAAPTSLPIGSSVGVMGGGKTKRCEHEGCESISPSYGIKGQGKARFCSNHKTAEMVNLRNPVCEQEGCESISPSFDTKGGKGRFCASHKTKEMVNVKHKRCEYEDCNIEASYGKPGYPKSRCSPHRQAGMIRRPNSKCVSCKEPAIWGINWTPIHCETHKTTEETNLVEKNCVSCGLLYVLDNENRCENCNPLTFTTVRLAKQNAVMSYLDGRQLKGDTTDIIIDGGVCGKERPDRVYDLCDKILVLECDEYQHNDRACLCEQTRMVNIAQSFGGVPVYFIRWNPDDYSPEANRKPEELVKRYKLLGDLISDIKQNKHTLPTALLSVLYMYYDGWNGLSETKWQILTHFE